MRDDHPDIVRARRSGTLGALRWSDCAAIAGSHFAVP
jgi:hypothetical protein